MLAHPSQAVIIGGGICGITAALALKKVGIPVVVYELRSGPATAGGAVNLTPVALRYLDHVGALEEIYRRGSRTKEVTIFSIPKAKRLGGYKFKADITGYPAVRATRHDLLQSLLYASAKENITIHYSAKLTSVSEDEDSITATFADGRKASGAMLLGCDGIYSATRLKYVDPSRKPEYTGTVAAGGVLKTATLKSPVHFEDACVNLSEHGFLVTAYCNKDRSNMYVALSLDKQANSHDGWDMTPEEAEATKQYMIEKYADVKTPVIKEIIQQWEDQFYWPVHELKGSGVWSKGRALLLGDACHAMPPNGESAGFCLEDAVLLATVFGKRGAKDLQAVFQEYIAIRRPEIDSARIETQSRWKSAQFMTPWQFRLRQAIIPWYLWWTESKRDALFSKDVRNSVV
ncbi:hypothetical protein PV10_05100 [Exophiala mesophila]|uniref:FAD-binding domain-containing protein n=1 Tax=Exophiala mesophila TaxID=212818 RepID=A0A0D1Y0A4_EXOME|nr:uncharacterized protein PV10_05100 [Exophiala mesophila]KIV93926.1 hypothetical protein PV10_05100 [Exophiala mesophila]